MEPEQVTCQLMGCKDSFTHSKVLANNKVEITGVHCSGETSMYDRFIFSFGTAFTSGEHSKRDPENHRISDRIEVLPNNFIL